MKNLSLKTIALTFSLVMLANLALHAEVVCTKEGRNWIPTNDTAKKIALSLGVKTCSGKRFIEVVAALGEKSNVVAAKKNLTVEETVASLKGKK